jgi:hypothetical protein
LEVLSCNFCKAAEEKKKKVQTESLVLWSNKGIEYKCKRGNGKEEVILGWG